MLFGTIGKKLMAGFLIVIFSALLMGLFTLEISSQVIKDSIGHQNEILAQSGIEKIH